MFPCNETGKGSSRYAPKRSLDFFCHVCFDRQCGVTRR